MVAAKNLPIVYTLNKVTGQIQSINTSSQTVTSTLPAPKQPITLQQWVELRLILRAALLQGSNRTLLRHHTLKECRL